MCPRSQPKSRILGYFQHMAKLDGQTDQVLEVKMTSVLALAHWLENELPINGDVGLEVMTAYVADGAPLTLTIKECGGATLDTVELKMKNNLARLRWKPKKPSDLTGKPLEFEAELKKHSLKKTSGPLKASAPVLFNELRWLDSEGKSLSEMSDSCAVICESKVKGLNEGDEVDASIWVSTAEGVATEDGKLWKRIHLGQVKVKQGKVALAYLHLSMPGIEKHQVQSELKPKAGNYHAPTYRFRMSAKGAAEWSAAIPYLSHIAFDLGPAPDGVSRKARFEMPDGTAVTKSVPEDGNVKVDAAHPGRVKFLGFGDG